MRQISKTEPTKLKDADWIITSSNKRHPVVHLTTSLIFKMRHILDPVWADEQIRQHIKDNYCIERWEIDTIVKRDPKLF